MRSLEWTPLGLHLSGLVHQSKFIHQHLHVQPFNKYLKGDPDPDLEEVTVLSRSHITTWKMTKDKGYYQTLCSLSTESFV